MALALAEHVTHNARDGCHQAAGGCVFQEVSQRCGDQCAKGQVPSQYQSLARYVATYVVSPPMAVRRIDRYDGERVTYHYRSHRTEWVERETVDVDTFIGRMVHHTMPKGCKRLRYYGCKLPRRLPR
jgi:hypothetical protein